MKSDFYRINRVPIAITNYDKTIEILRDSILEGDKGYVCVSNMRTVTLANQDDKYYDLMEHSLMNVPDNTIVAGNPARVIKEGIEFDGRRI